MTHALSHRVLVLASAAILMGCTAQAGASARSPATSPDHAAAGPPARVVVRQATPQDPRPARLVERLGGRVVQRLPIVDGFAATVPAGAVPVLAAAPGVLAVLPDGDVAVAGPAHEAERPRFARPTAPRLRFGRTRLVDQEPEPAPEPDPVPVPPGPRQVFREVVGASELNARGVSGGGTTVALIDTGVAQTPDLAGRMVQVRDGIGGLLGGSASCKNLSREAGCGDTYGHGTFIAGLIAGNGRSDGGRYKGVAPEARLLSVKIAGRDGSSDVSTLLEAIQWVVSHRQTYGIKVLNLSLGTESTQSYKVDPLNYAVERAWRAGIVVVTAASNRGPGVRTIAKPGDDPYVITVGAVDDRGTVGRSDDVVADFSARGPTAADGLPKPDVVAPGARVVSLNSKDSLIDRQYPEKGPYRRASGTSMATGIVSGLAALLVAAQKDATPDRVKFMLTSTSRPVAGADAAAVGSGVVDGWQASTAAPAGLANRGLGPVAVAGVAGLEDVARRAAGLDPSRGGVRTGTVAPMGSAGPLGAVLSGSRTPSLANWRPSWVLGEWTEQTWHRTAWQLRTILPARWDGTDWSGRNWQWHGPPGTRRPRAVRRHGRPAAGSAWYGVWG